MNYNDILAWLKENKDNQAIHPNFYPNIYMIWNGEEVVLMHKGNFDSYDSTGKLSRLSPRWEKLTNN